MASPASAAAPPGGGTAAPTCVDAFDVEYDYVCRVLRRFHLRDADIEDVAQEVFLVAWRRWREYDVTRPLRPWLAGIAFRVAYNHRGRSSREIPEGCLEPEAPDTDPERGLAEADIRSVVRRALDGIGEKQRTVLILHDVDEVTMRDIAGLLAIPLHTAYSRLRVGRRQLLAALRRIQTVSGANNQLGLPGQLDEWLARERQSEPIAPERKRAAVARLRALVPLLPAPLDLLPHAPPRSSLVTAASVAASIGISGVVLFGLLTTASRSRNEVGAAAAAAALASPSAPAAIAPRGQPQPDRLAAPGKALTSVFARGTAAPAEATAGAAVLKGDGLIGYWRLDDGAGSAYARDLSGSGSDCTLRQLDRGVTWAEGQHGSAIHFGGAGWLECPQPTAAATGEELTVAMWIKRAAQTARVRALISRQLGHELGDAFHFGFSGDDLVLHSSLWRVTLLRGFPAAYNDHWHHVAATRGRDRQARIYIDGALVVSKKTGTVSSIAEQGALIIGGGVNGPDADRVTERFAGAIDEVVVFDRALSPAEIAALASGAQPRVSQ